MHRSRLAWLTIACVLHGGGIEGAEAQRVGQTAAKPYVCPAIPKPVRDLDIPRFYGDADGAKVDPKLEILHKAAVRPLVEFVSAMAIASDRTVEGNHPDAGRCALTWLNAWAEADAWQGDMVTRQAEYQRKWDLAGVALAYVKLKPLATAEQRAAIEPWLQRWAAKARAFFDDPSRKRNNHWYWLGLAQIATALATDSDAHWQTARGIYLDALRDIRPDGILPMELERQERGLFYHVFAMMPLVVMAEIAARRGEDWYGLEGGAVHRLVTLCLDGLASPQSFEKLAGKPQEQPVNARSGWLSLYKARFPERVSTAKLPTVPDKHRLLGGDIRLLLRTIDARQSR